MPVSKFARRKVQVKALGTVEHPLTGKSVDVHFRTSIGKIVGDERVGLPDRRVGVPNRRKVNRRKLQRGKFIAGVVKNFVERHRGTYFGRPPGVSAARAFVVSNRQFARISQEGLHLAGRGEDWVAIWSTRRYGRRRNDGRRVSDKVSKRRPPLSKIVYGKRRSPKNRLPE